jgi:hypothetical protein
MATGTSSTASTPAFHADDPEQTSDYRTLSVLAIISLVFGLAAPLAFGGPLLRAIPLFGIAISLLALRRIAVSGGVLTGRGLAITGLVLCVASTIAPFTRDLVQRSIREHQAKRFSQNWLELITSGELEQGLRLTMEGNRPQAPSEPGMPPGPGVPPAPKKSSYEIFLDEPLIKALKDVGANAEIRFDGTLDYQPATYRSMTVRQQFTVSPPSTGGSQQPVNVVVTVQRAPMSMAGVSRWLVARYENANVAGTGNPAAGFAGGRVGVP